MYGHWTQTSTTTVRLDSMMVRNTAGFRYKIISQNECSNVLKKQFHIIRMWQIKDKEFDSYLKHLEVKKNRWVSSISDAIKTKGCIGSYLIVCFAI